MLIFALLLPGMLFGTVGIVKQDRSKLLGWVLSHRRSRLLPVARCMRQRRGVKTPSTDGGTPAGLYTVTVTGSANGTQHSTTVSIKVN